MSYFPSDTYPLRNLTQTRDCLHFCFRNTGSSDRLGHVNNSYISEGHCPALFNEVLTASILPTVKGHEEQMR